MKRLLKAPLKAIWKVTSGVRRPVVNRFAGFMSRCFSTAVAPQLTLQAQQLQKHGEVLQAQGQTVASLVDVTKEMNLHLDNLVRELVRLQFRMEAYEEATGRVPTLLGPVEVGSETDSDHLPARKRSA